MNGPLAASLPGGRLHLHHGPIDLVIRADGAANLREIAYAAAERRFATILEELVAELPGLRRPLPKGSDFSGATARRMAAAVRPHRGIFVTPMAAVAGAVAEEILAAMTRAAPLPRAYVNNGGDIALHFSAKGPEEPPAFVAAIAGLDGSGLGRINVTRGSGVRGIATSGQGGRSLSMGIADSVTVLADCASSADVAATLIANAVDLPHHRCITRQPANELQADSDLGSRPVVTGVGALTHDEIATALERGVALARRMQGAGVIQAAALLLRGQIRFCGPLPLAKPLQGEVEHA